jgi:hypothetical protein
MSEALQPKRFRQFVIALCDLVQAIYRQEATDKPTTAQDASAPSADLRQAGQQQPDTAAGKPPRNKGTGAGMQA